MISAVGSRRRRLPCGGSAHSHSFRETVQGCDTGQNGGAGQCDCFQLNTRWTAVIWWSGRTRCCWNMVHLVTRRPRLWRQAGFFFLRFYCKNIEFDNTLQKHQHKHDTRRAQEHNLLVRDSSLNCAFNPPQKQFLSNFQTLRGSNEQHNYICFSGGGRRGGGAGGGLITTYLILNVTVGVKAARLDSRCQ